MKKVLFLYLIFSCVFFSCKGQNESSEIFEQVWTNVNNHYFDSNFNGLDWLEIKTKYAPKVAECKNNESLFSLLNQMLFELNSSHCGVGLLSDIKNNISPYIFEKGEIGLDVRVIENQIIVTNVSKNSSADYANVKTGYRIKKIDGITLNNIIQNIEYKPPFNDRNKKFHLTTEVLRLIYGEPNTKVKIEFIDEYEKIQTKILERTIRKNGIQVGSGLPNAFVESNSYFISKNIAYLSFNAFLLNNIEEVLKNLEKVYSSKGLILDLRGNDGGSIQAMKMLLGRFVSKRLKYGTFINRYEENDDYIEPVAPQYKGEIVLLIDEMSISGAENTAGIFKQLNLGKVIGTHTPGQLLWGNGYQINENIVLVIPIYKIEYLTHFNPENNGITPDFEVQLNRQDLLNNEDSQLSFAINYLNNIINQQ